MIERLVIDMRACTRCGLCWLIAPEVFDPSDLERPVPPSPAALLAMEECPTAAIVWSLPQAEEENAILHGVA